MSEITRIATKRISLPMKGSLSWGKSSKLARLEHVLVKVEAGSVFGIAEAPARPSIYGETPESIEVIIKDHLAPKLLGEDAFNETALWEAFHSVANNQTARGALDIALHDLRAKLNGETLFDTAGPHQNLRASFILGISDFDTMLAEARTIFENGVSVFKIKVGRNAAHDEAVIKALQSEFSGEDVILYADANEGLDSKTAANDLERLAKLGIAYVEEPLPVRQLKARARLKSENVLPIIADDSCFSLLDLERELDFDTFDILNIKTARTGYSESQKMLGLALKANKGVMLGSQASAGLGTLHTALFATQAGIDYPSELSFPLKLHEDVFTSALSFHKGLLAVSNLTELELKSEYLTF